jgi:hypothetical protein
VSPATGEGDGVERAHDEGKLGSAAPPLAPDATTVKLYKLAVEMADRVSARRALANSFFVGVHTVITALVGVLHPLAPALPSETGRPFPFASLLAAAAGATLAVAWWVMLRSYRDLNRAKFTVINKLEERLPVRIFTDEWAVLKPPQVKSWRGRYTELGQVERLVPVVFFLLYLGSIVLLLLGI